MSETLDTEGTGRAFWGTDYRRYAKVIRDTRRDHGDAAADAIAGPVVAALSADNADFDADRFLAGTHVIPAYVGALSNALKTGTHKRCEPWTPADDAKLAKVAALGSDLAGVLAGSVPHFKAEVFMASVQPPVRPGTETAGSVDEYDEDDDDN